METTNRGRHGTSWAHALLIFWVASCGTEAGPIAVDPMDPNKPRAMQERQLTDSMRVRAVDYGEGRAAVSIRDTAGQLLFGAEYTLQDESHVLVTNKINLGALQHDDAGVVEDSYFIDRSDADKFSLDDAVTGAAIIHGQYLNVARHAYATEDTTGCTLPIIGTATSCSNKGACCDQHDKCYFEYHCDYLSWDAKGPATEACKKCNDVVKTCPNPFNPSPGPAACCAPDLKKNTCGTESPKWNPSTPIPKFPNGITASGLDPALAIPGSPVRGVLPDLRDAGIGSATASADSGQHRVPRPVQCAASQPKCPQAKDEDPPDCDRAASGCKTEESDVEPSVSTEDESDDSDLAADEDGPGSDDESADEESSDEESSDEESSDEESSDEESSDEDGSDEASSDEESSDEDSSDEDESADEDTSDEDTSDEDSFDEDSFEDDPGAECGEDCWDRSAYALRQRAGRAPGVTA